MTAHAATPAREDTTLPGLRDGERGSGGTSLAFILLIPAVLLLIFGGTEFGLHSYARSLAVAAAHAGVRAAVAAPASTDRGRDAAQDFLDHQAASTLTDTTVTIQQSSETITVTITAAAPSLIPRTTPRVIGEATAHIEHLP